MKTSTILFLVGSVVIIGSGVLVFMMVTKPAAEVAPAMTDVAATTTSAEAETTSGSASILGLMTGADGKSMECKFVFTDEGMRSEGAGFFMDGKARVDTLYSDETNGQIASYMIMDTPADTMYVWSLANGEQTGMKLSISENNKMAATLPSDDADADSTPTAQQISPDSDVQYTCKPWIPDTTVFTPPANVQFTDMTDMTKMMNEMMGGMKLPTN